MARRGKTSNAEALIELTSHLPWWLCVVLAIVGSVACHALAVRPLILSPGESPSSLFGPTYIRSLAMAGQYLIPIVFLVGAVVSFARRRRRSGLIAKVVQPNAACAIEQLSWQDFELLVGEAYRRRGYQVEERGGSAADGGVDLILTRPSQNGREKVLVQCKHWRAYRVGVDVVRELYGVMAASGASAGVVVTSGSFTVEATTFASGRNLTLLDGPRLVELIGPISKSKAKESSVTSTPACPSCSKPMVRRVAKQGAKAGSPFWGCSAFPACRGTRPVFLTGVSRT